jgi:hypothetical protein
MDEPDTTHRLDDLKHVWRRTRPWTPEEFIYVDGQPRVYTVKHNALIVRLPGGMAVHVNTLRSMGCRVTMPTTLRTNDYA